MLKQKDQAMNSLESLWNAVLARIAADAPRTARRAVFAAFVVLGAGAVFGADEKKDAVPAPAPIPAQTTASPEAAPGAEKPPGEPPEVVPTSRTS